MIEAAMAAQRPLRLPPLVRPRPTKPMIAPTIDRQQVRLRMKPMIETASVFFGGSLP